MLSVSLQFLRPNNRNSKKNMQLINSALILNISKVKLIPKKKKNENQIIKEIKNERNCKLWILGEHQF